MATKRKSAKPVWKKPRPKSLGKSKKLTPAQKASAKAAAKKAGRKYPNLVDNMRAAKGK
jgi:ribosomal protein L15E